MKDALKPYLTYKNSGVPWLGDVPQHWQCYLVGHAIDKS
jgi:hypothetical protein